MDDYDKLVYICSPFAHYGHIEDNLKKTRGYCRMAFDKGYIPYAPHLYFPQFVNDNDAFERSRVFVFDAKIMKKCNEIWVFGTMITSGMAEEIGYAVMAGIRVRRFTDNGEEVIDE